MSKPFLFNQEVKEIVTNKKLSVYYEDEGGNLFYTKEFIEWWYSKIKDPEKWLGVDWDTPHDYILKESEDERN